MRTPERNLEDPKNDPAAIIPEQFALPNQEPAIKRRLLTPSLVSSVSFSAIVLIGLLMLSTDSLISVSLLYLVPILLVTAFSGATLGFLAALLASGLWLASDLGSLHGVSGTGIAWWNAFMRLGTFGVAIALVSTMKSLNKSLEVRIASRTSELREKLAENSRLEKKVLEVGDEEKARIGQDIHDGLCQELISVALSLRLLREERSRNHEIADSQLERLQGMVDGCISQARNISRGLFPASLESDGLEIALRQLAANCGNRTTVDVQVDCSGNLLALDSDIAGHLYRIAQEAVTNALRHSGATVVNIRVSADAPQFVLQIADNGRGTASGPVNREGMGRKIMAYRARMIGAEITFEDSGAGGGHLVQCRYQTPP